MVVSFDLLSIFPYLFTLICVFGQGVFFTFIFMVFMIVGKSNTFTLPVVQPSENNDHKSNTPLPYFSPNQFDEVLPVVEKSVADLFPANKITVRCGGCHKPIGAGQGYLHYNIGERKTFCQSCHLSKGLPLRALDDSVSSPVVGEVRKAVTS